MIYSPSRLTRVAAVIAGSLSASIASAGSTAAPVAKATVQIKVSVASSLKVETLKTTDNHQALGCLRSNMAADSYDVVPLEQIASAASSAADASPSRIQRLNSCGGPAVEWTAASPGSTPLTLIVVPR